MARASTAGDDVLGRVARGSGGKSCELSGSLGFKRCKKTGGTGYQDRGKTRYTTPLVHQRT